ncbi:MAG: hypothetical protein WAU28_00340 [Candidatus Moraniibacteriota bacterium]
MDFISQQIFLFLSIGGLLFLPGFLALRICFGKKTPLNSFETTLTASALSFGFLDFLMILLGKNHILLTPYSITCILLTLLLVCLIMRKILPTPKDTASEGTKRDQLHFTRMEGSLFLLILFLTLFTKSIFLSDAAFPTSTDLGHHSYWSKGITETGTLPQYTKRDIIVESDSTEQLSKPEPIADFIIGEHLPFAALALFSGSTFISAFPVIVLFLINILSLLAYFVLALRLGEEIQKKFISFVPMHFGLIVLFLQGPLYTIASPQAKFVSGGVVGNTFGNFFIPIILLFFYRAIREKNPVFMGLAFFFTFTLAYTHHLSTLVLLFILVASIITQFLLHIHSLNIFIRDWRKIILHPVPLTIAFLCTLFFFTVAMPTYIETHAVGTALGTPTKLTRTGLTFAEILSGSGEARAVLGIAGLVLIALFARAFKNTAGLLLPWTVILLIMSMKPSLVFLDIPSNRIGSYALFPLAFLAAFVLLLLSEYLQKISLKKNLILPAILPASLIIILFVYAVGSGSSDNGGSLLSAPKSTEAVQTFAVSQFLSERIRPEDIILKDHNYLSADSFMKLFFMRDYGFPLSRGYFKRYETPGHEQCSLTMIASPNTTAGKKCLAGTGTDIIIVNPLFDRIQFEKSPDFSRIYSSPLIHVYSL